MLDAGGFGGVQWMVEHGSMLYGVEYELGERFGEDCLKRLSPVFTDLA